MEWRDVDEQVIGRGMGNHSHPVAVAGLEQGLKCRGEVIRFQPPAGIDQGTVYPDGIVAVFEALSLLCLEVFTREPDRRLHR